ncbi:MAG: hypothetical protein NC238_01380, partial [Dehalobacter sp.]|nr:hypothetical protein [Dehalobacter sp.]
MVNACNGFLQYYGISTCNFRYFYLTTNSEKFLEGLSSFVGNVFGRQTSDVINSFRKDGRFKKSFSTALNIAIERFFNEYQDTEIIAAIKKDKDFLSREPVR